MSVGANNRVSKCVYITREAMSCWPDVNVYITLPSGVTYRQDTTA
jgi:hypothetical protein